VEFLQQETKRINDDIFALEAVLKKEMFRSGGGSVAAGGGGSRVI